MLLDLQALQAGARQQGAELSFRKLLRAIAGDRRVARAICCLSEPVPDGARRALEAAGFELRGHDAADATALAAMAVELTTSSATLVLAPCPAASEPLLTTLQDRGTKVECATFDGRAPSGAVARQLGRDCLFVP